MKKIIFITTLVILTIVMYSCSNNNQVREQREPDINITTSVNPSDGLDIKLVGALIQDGTCKNAEELEREINKDGGINNLDLDGDGKIDYINVVENDPQGNSTFRSFDLTTGSNDNLTNVATIEVEKVGNEYKIHMSGNEQIYGSGCYHTMHCGPSFAELAFFHWMFMPRPIYYHPYYYPGYYPRYYGSSYSRPSVVSRTAYTQRTITQRKVISSSKIESNSTKRQSTIKSSSYGKVSPSVRTSINNNKSSQRSFQTRNNNKSIGSGGFTRNKSNSSSRSSSYSSSSSSRSSSYGSSSSSRSSGSRSSFGSSSSSRSSGSRSSFGSSSSSRGRKR